MIGKKYRSICILLTALFAVFVFLLPHLLLGKIGANAQTTKLLDAYIGVWEGNGIQSNKNEWSILISLIPGAVDSVVGTIAHPSLACGGKLTLRRINTGSVELFKNVTYGSDRCFERGTVTLQIVGNRRLRYNWFHPNGRQDGDGVVNKISAN